MLGSSKNPTWVDLESDLSKLTPDEQVMIKRVLVKDAIVNNGETFSYRSGFALGILAWCPIQMRAFHSNENGLFCSHRFSIRADEIPKIFENFHLKPFNG